MDEAIELRPCPFCNQLDCKHLKVLRSENMSDALWNIRPIEDALRFNDKQWEKDFADAVALIKKCEDWLSLFQSNQKNNVNDLNTANYLYWDIHNFLNEAE